MASFAWTDDLPIKFLGRAASNGMLQTSRRNIHIYLWHGVTFAAWPCRTLPLCATRHSVDVPLYCTETANYIQFRAQRRQKYAFYRKKLQIKVVQN